MSIYRTITEVGQKFVSKATLFRYGFNWSPMYRRSTGKLFYVSPDLHEIKLRIPISYKNRNYMNTIFGGSMFSAVDPIPMIQLTQILGNQYVVWDKSAEIKFKQPGKDDLYADFIFTPKEIATIQERVASENEIEIFKLTQLTYKDDSKVICEVNKKIYIASKAFYKEKLANRKNKNILI